MIRIDLNVWIFIHIFPVLVTKLSEKAGTLELQVSSGKKTEEERSKMDTFKPHSTLMYTNSLCGFMTTTVTTIIGFVCRLW